MAHPNMSSMRAACVTTPLPARATAPAPPAAAASAAAALAARHRGEGWKAGWAGRPRARAMPLQVPASHLQGCQTEQEHPHLGCQPPTS